MIANDTTISQRPHYVDVSNGLQHSNHFACVKKPWQPKHETMQQENQLSKFTFRNPKGE